MPDTRHCDAVSSGTGKSHVALALGLAACQRGFAVGFVTAAGLVHQLMEARDEKRLLRFQAQLAAAGHSPAAIGRITCPIGQPGITGKDPAVIAVAVTAALLPTLTAGLESCVTA